MYAGACERDSKVRLGSALALSSTQTPLWNMTDDKIIFHVLQIPWFIFLNWD